MFKGVWCEEGGVGVLDSGKGIELALICLLKGSGRISFGLKSGNASLKAVKNWEIRFGVVIFAQYFAEPGRNHQL